VASSVVIDGLIATISIDVTVEQAGAAADIPTRLTAPASDAEKEKLEAFRARLSSLARTSFASTAVRAQAPKFTSATAGAVTANVSVETQGSVTMTAPGFTSGVTSLEKEFEPEVGSHIAAVIGGTPPPKVTATNSRVSLGAGALNATPAEAPAEGGDLGLTQEQLRTARAVSVIGLIAISAFVVAFLNRDLLTEAAIGAAIGIAIVIAIWSTSPGLGESP
jgi:hypothetical protein